MRLLPNTKRKDIIFNSLSEASGFVAAALLSAVTTFVLSGYAVQILFPEVNEKTVGVAAVITALFTAVVYLFSAEWVAYTSAAVLGSGALFLFLPDIIESLETKILLVGIEIYKYSPQYDLGYRYHGDPGLTAAVLALTVVCGIVLTHFIVRCKIIVPVVLTSALTAGLFVCLERTDSMYFYMCILCVIAMLCISAQAKAGAAMGAVLPVTKVGTKITAFFLATLLVLMPVATDQSFSKSVMDLISQLTGIAPPGVSPGGYGDASGDVSWEGFEQLLADLEERQAKTDLEDIEFQNILLYVVSGAPDKEDIFFRRRIYDSYSDSTWTLATSVSNELLDNAMQKLADAQRDNMVTADWRQSTLIAAAARQPLHPPVATGTVRIISENAEMYYDLDRDGIDERYPAYMMMTHRFVGFESDVEWFDFLRYYSETSPDLRLFGEEDFYNEEISVSGDKLLDKELKALAVNLLRKYFGYQSYEDWLQSPDAELDAVRAVQRYLTETKFYTMNPQMSDRYVNYDHSKDSIYNFLFNTGEGYCVQFASTAVLLLRSIGVDARYVTGYVSRSSDNNGNRHIYDSDSHAWCEVNINGLGWVPIEMTYGAMINSISSDGPVLDPPNFPEDVSQPEESSEDISETVSEEVSEDVSEEVSDESSETESSVFESEVVSEGVDGSVDVIVVPGINKKALIYCISALVCVIIVVLICALIYRRNEKRRKRIRLFREQCAGGEGDAVQGLVELHTQHIAILKMLGYTPIKAEKHGEYASRIHRSDPDMPNPVNAMKYFEKAEFGGKPTTDELKAAGAHLLALNDYAYRKSKGLRKKYAYFKGIITKPRK